MEKFKKVLDLIGSIFGTLLLVCIVIALVALIYKAFDNNALNDICQQFGFDYGNLILFKGNECVKETICKIDEIAKGICVP